MSASGFEGKWRESIGTENSRLKKVEDCMIKEEKERSCASRRKRGWREQSGKEVVKKMRWDESTRRKLMMDDAPGSKYGCPGRVKG